MKTSHQILIIIFVVLSFFIIKDDIHLALNKILTNKNNDDLHNNIIYSEKEKLLELKVDTPGALKVVDKFLTTDENIKLNAENIIAITNKYRQDNGIITPLSMENKLNLSAQVKLEDMFENQYFEHNSPDGVGVSDLGDQSGYDYLLIGENLAMGNFKNDLALVNAWMNSPGHRENILNKNYKEIGVAVGRGLYNGQKVWMAVQHFGTPEDICPGIDKVLLGTININQDKILEIRDELLIRQEIINKREYIEGSTLFEQIDSYNELVNLYNNLIIETKQKTEIYNDQVKNFNSCLVNYQ